MAAQKRLQREFMDWSGKTKGKTPPSFATAELDGDNLYKWNIVLTGPDKSPFEGGKFKLELEAPTEFPFKPPKIIFKTPIYHPNVDEKGVFCMEILTDSWSPQLKIEDIFVVLLQFLREPNPGHFLRPEIGEKYNTDKKGYEKTAKQWVKKHCN